MILVVTSPSPQVINADNEDRIKQLVAAKHELEQKLVS